MPACEPTIDDTSASAVCRGTQPRRGGAPHSTTIEDPGPGDAPQRHRRALHRTRDQLPGDLDPSHAVARRFRWHPMNVPRKIGAHGRTTNVVAGKRFRKVLGLPQGVGWSVPVPGNLLNSPAWLAMSDRCRKLVDALMAEHADHGGVENGNLKAPYDMLVARGMRRARILDAVVEGKALGIVDHLRGVRSYGYRKVPSTYRLTWLGTPDGLTPTKEWKAVKSQEEAERRIE